MRIGTWWRIFNVWMAARQACIIKCLTITKELKIKDPILWLYTQQFYLLCIYLVQHLYTEIMSSVPICQFRAYVSLEKYPRFPFPASRDYTFDVCITLSGCGLFKNYLDAALRNNYNYKYNMLYVRF